MAKVSIAKRFPVLAGKSFADDGVSVSVAPPASRCILRANAEGAKVFSKSLGFDLPMTCGETVSEGGTSALWIGPDEWLLIDKKQPDTSMVPKLPNPNFAATDVSHRNAAAIVSGPGAANTLNASCPRDLSLSAFPKGTASRTILGKAEVVLHRTANDTFHVEFWRSFAPYVWKLLRESARDASV